MRTRRDTHINTSPIKTIIPESSQTPELMNRETNCEQELYTKGHKSAKRAMVNVKQWASESSKLIAKNERRDISKIEAEGKNYANSIHVKEQHLTFASTHLFENHLEQKSPNYTSSTSLPDFSNSTSITLQNNDDTASFASAVAYATSLINSNDTLKPCVDTTMDSTSDDNSAGNVVRYL